MSAAAETSEELLLGGLLASARQLATNAAVLLTESGLGAEDFGDARVRLAVKICARLGEHQRPVDANTVYFAAKEIGPVDVELLPWLQMLEARSTFDKPGFRQAAESFRRVSRSRAVAVQLRALASALEQKQATPAQISVQLEAFANQLAAHWSPDHTGDEDVIEVFNDWSFAGKEGGRPSVLPTGITAIDEVLAGWVKLNLIIGAPSVGKSALAGAGIDAQLRAGRRPGLFGLEDGSVWLARRIIAREMNVPVGEIGARPMTVGEELRSAELGQALTDRMKALTTYRFRGIAIEELLRRARDWVTDRGVDSVWIDNLSMIRPRQHWRDFHRGVGEVLDYLARFSERHKVPVILLAHTKRPEGKEHIVGPPSMFEIAETSMAEKYAFTILGLWEKRPGAMRCTVLKAKERERRKTVELDWLGQSALVSDEGREVNLAKERREEREERERALAERKRETRRAGVVENIDLAEEKQRVLAERAAKRAAEEAAKKPQQQSLLASAEIEKPKEPRP